MTKYLTIANWRTVYKIFCQYSINTKAIKTGMTTITSKRKEESHE